jgi:anti-anti-sigma factor
MRFLRLPHRRRTGSAGLRRDEVVRLRGDLDARNAASTGRRLARLIDAGPEVLEVDLANLKYLSPAGCAALFIALRAARARGTRLVITHPDDRARSVLNKTGLSHALSHQNGGAR